MSDKMVVEFYGTIDQRITVLVLHGGDNPASASLTLTAFLAGIGHSIKGFVSAGELASRFIVSQASLDLSQHKSPELDALLIESAAEYGYQLCRLYLIGGTVKAVVVLDQYSRTAEVREAGALWNIVGIPCEFLSHAEAAA